ncbi:phosphoribosylglycinamide formyltransferase [Parvularcula maris]|uniref:Phosphoribosylglycinamide formyltransferase n=1 Tax=Parvularcula maris TaxID=2965077 RepID=A0A9X2RHU2_9PROT|nr:phosphoribosylglycinamide formyltransferase [Parvularcula maris]MCQ8185234.1 phosphoribosylglycinamide formyltransferase [Parvularcula maris]
MTARIAILISGRGSNMEVLVKAHRAGVFPGEIVLVLSNKEGAAGLDVAEELGVPTATVPSKGRSRDAFEADLSNALSAAEADFVCLAGFMRVLTPGFVSKWEGRMVNIHPSLLPSFIGLHVQEQAIAAGTALSGCTVHYVTADLDAGPIIGQAAVPLLAGDAAETLSARIQKAEHRLYPLAVARALGGEPTVLAEDGVLLSVR